jgi:hypothetical protein
MIHLLWFLVLVSSPSHAFVHSLSAGFTRVSSDSEFQDSNKKSLLEFKPNVATGRFIGLETKHLALGYVFAGKLSEEEAANGESRFQDYRFNFHLHHFDFRLSVQSYAGALVEEGGKKFFYQDYTVRSTNARFHYYTNPRHLDLIRPGYALTKHSSKNSGFRASGSWLLGVNVDDRKLHLPETLQTEHQAILTARGISYDSRFQASSWGPLIGYDGLLELSRFFFRLKLALGAAFQGESSTTDQSEVGVMIGYAFGSHHLLTVGTETFALSFKDEKKYINNTNTQSNFQYTYAF